MTKPWFAPKRPGYGAGWPIAWQGWAVLAAYGAAVVAALATLERLALVGAIVGLTAALVAFVARRTDGEWRWRPEDPPSP
ncbi:hypothetical protein [Phenylobacterium sp.]|jgi:hypothetical protein|uniref:hypothetical protein n=1 Tax=Phenylobacterium sp. TaxID=1871053 RepID=UPI003783DB22